MKKTTISLTEKVNCLERELLMRRRVYPRLIQQSKLTQSEADFEINIMQAILNDYKQQAKTDLGELPLFSK